MLRIEFKFFNEYFEFFDRHCRKGDLVQFFISWFGSQNKVDYDMFESRGAYKYRYLFTIKTPNNSKIVLGLFHNNYTVEGRRKGFIEFNPNKVLDSKIEHWQYADKNELLYSDDIFNMIFEKLQDLCEDIKVRRFDFAIDVPIDRKLVHLQKDKRKYSMYRVSEDDYTEYLSNHNDPGFVKVYNKQKESNLDSFLTRIEITSELETYESFMERFPIVQLEGFQSEVDYSALNSTEFVLVQLLNKQELTEREQYLKCLDYKKQKKLKPFIYQKMQALTLEEEIYYDILKHCVLPFHNPKRHTETDNSIAVKCESQEHVQTAILKEIEEVEMQLLNVKQSSIDEFLSECKKQKRE